MLAKAFLWAVDALLTQDQEGKRHPKPAAWFVVAGALLVLLLSGWSYASAGASWLRRVDAHIEAAPAETQARQRLEGKVDEMGRDVRLILDGLVRKGLAEAPTPAPTPGGAR